MSISKRKRIGLDARLAYRRGVGTYTANLILALAKIKPGHQFFIFNAPENLKNQVHNPSFNWIEVPFPNAAYYEQILLPRAARKSGVDFLHYTDNTATLFDPIPFVLTLHDMMHLRSMSDVRAHPSIKQRFLHLYKKWVVPRSIARARAILTVSEYSKSQIISLGGANPEQVRVTLEGVDRDLFKNERRKNTGLFKILVHGAADDRKNITNILKAAQRLVTMGRKFQMIVIGMDKTELGWTHYIQDVLDLQIGAYVEWVGPIPLDMLNNVYAESDLFLYPSRMEGFGLPVLEAFACGVPVVTSNTTSLPEVAGKAALLVDPEDPEAIARAVVKIMDDPRFRERFIREGLIRSKEFTWEKTARETSEVYEQVRC
jgi:glycosyltransferase involved in cell wall biosynthesis